MKKIIAISLTAAMILCFSGSAAFAATTSPIQYKTNTLHKVSTKNNKVKSFVAKEKAVSKARTKVNIKTASKAKAKIVKVKAKIVKAKTKSITTTKK